MSRYAGPLRAEPLAVELHNTLYATSEGAMDGLSDVCGARAWLAAIADRLPEQARGKDIQHDRLLALRTIVREALTSVLAGDAVPPTALDALNAASAAAPSAPQLVHGASRTLEARIHHQASDATAVLLGALAADAISIVGGAQRELLRACGAPGCVLMFLKDHPRREWCSPACGNRARQARHYQRTHRSR
jgi:predicted RNA-binding Zn ribbon-like protein